MAKRSSIKKNTEKAVPRVDIVYKDLYDMVPYDKNPRFNDAAIESVANSIKTFGFLVPIVLDDNNVIVAGHTRYEASKTLGLSEVPCVIAGALSDDQIAAFRIIDNKVSELAAWDFDALAGEIAALNDSGIALTEFGWSREELDCMTDLVADDCMAAGVVTDLENRQQDARAQQRAPNTSRIVISEFVFFIPQQVYRNWANALRVEFDYEESAIVQELKNRLGITPYEDAHRRDNP